MRFPTLDFSFVLATHSKRREYGSRLLLGCFCLFLSVSSNLFAQVSPSPLQIADTKLLLPAQTQSIMAPYPGLGGFYISTGPTSFVWDSLDGTKSVPFDAKLALSSDDDPKTSQVRILDIRPLGEDRTAALIEVIKISAENVTLKIIEFSKNGDMDRSVSLEQLGFKPVRFAVFPSGEFFLEGIKSEAGALTSLQGAIVDSFGSNPITVNARQILLATESADTHIPSTSTKKSSNGAEALPELRNIHAANLALLASGNGNDDYVYSMSAERSNLVTRIDRTGNLTPFNLSPKAATTDHAFSMNVTNGRVAVIYATPKKNASGDGSARLTSTRIDTFFLSDGSQFASYPVPEQNILPFLLSYDPPDDFWLIQTKTNDPRGIFFIAHLTH